MVNRDGANIAYAASELLTVTEPVIIDFHNEEQDPQLLADLIHGLITKWGRKGLRDRLKIQNSTPKTARTLRTLINSYEE